MGGKHLKKLRAERAKVQLKKKKLLPKGQNITDTSFKAKKIVLVEQLKKVGENEPVSSWNLTLKDLISRLTHHNYMTRLNSLNGIRELITNYPQVLEGASLRIIITRILELLIDVEHKIRVTAIGLLNDVFSRLPSHYLVPFYDLFNVHVGCAMTHRELSIQQDSLKFIDVMVQHTPKAVEKNFVSLVQNFIRIIMSFRYGHHTEVNFSKKSKLDVEKSKVDMLKRFQLLLKVVYGKSKITSENIEDTFVEIPSKKSRFDLKVLDNSYTKIPDLSKLFKVTHTHSSPLTENQNSANEYQLQVSAIVPLLINIWMEFAPNPTTDEYTSECLLTEGVAQLLLNILQIILLLYEKATFFEDNPQEHWFVQTFGSSISQTFMVHFPYSPSITSVINEQASNQELFCASSKSAYKSQNLILCYLYQQFKNHLMMGKDLEIKVDKFILDTMRTKNPNDFKILIKVVEAMVKEASPAKLVEITALAVKVHKSTSIPEYRRRLFAILSKLAVSDELSDLRKTSYFKKWMKSLPEKLLQPQIPLYVVETLLKIASRESGREILKNLEETAVRIASELPNIRVSDKEEFEGQKLVANILYRCNNEVLKQILSGPLTSDSYPAKVRDYLTDIISFKLKNQKN